MNDNTNTATSPVSDNNPQADDLAVITIDDLRSIGIDLPQEQMLALIRHAEDSINERIGEEIISSLDDDQVQELVALQQAGASDEQVEEWIVERVTSHQEIVEDNIAIVLGDLAESADAIVAAQ